MKCVHNLNTAMKPHMTEAEFTAFVGFVGNAACYTEFGAGGSTYIATQIVKDRVISVDSSREWLHRVEKECAGEECKAKLDLCFVDIGPVGEWGTPINDPEYRSQWPDYYQSVWALEGSASADLYFIDGRFRVACTMQILLNCHPDSLILIHDFAPRSNYHVVRDVAREIFSYETLSAFLPRHDIPKERLNELLIKHRFDYA